MNKCARSPVILLIFATALMMVSCSHSPRIKPPPQLQLAERLNQEGIDAEQKDHFSEAEARFSESYRLYAAVEHYHGMVTALVNRSRLFRRQGMTARAEAAMTQADTLVVHTPDLRSEVFFENSRIAMLQGDTDGALRWAESAAAAAGEADRGRMANLLAGVYKVKGDTHRSTEFATAGLKLSRGSGNRREEANSHRLAGDAALVEKRYPDALQHYETALFIDKELAMTERVTTDLSALSTIAHASGDIVGAAAYLQRSVDTALAAGKSASAVADLERLAGFYSGSGRSDLAERAIAIKNTLLQKQAE